MQKKRSFFSLRRIISLVRKATDKFYIIKKTASLSRPVDLNHGVCLVINLVFMTSLNLLTCRGCNKPCTIVSQITATHDLHKRKRDDCQFPQTVNHTGLVSGTF